MSGRGHRFICHQCAWNWSIHWWLPFDFKLARIAHRPHMRKLHASRPVRMAGGGVKWVAAAAVALGAALAAPAHADPPPWSDPHYPDITHSSCAGGRGGAFGFGWCDGEHYADGTFWHQVFGAGADLAKPHCVRDDGSAQPPAAPGGCGGYG
jgi:hypothetical protein